MQLFKLLISLIISILLFGLIGCSSSLPEIRTTTKVEDGIYKDDLRININQLYAWINLMPGDKPRFHITGSVELLDASEYNFENVTIKEINILQNNQSIYKFIPKVEEESRSNIKTFIFSTVRGLLYTSLLKKGENIDVELLISDSSNEIIYLINDVEISEVY